MGSPLIKQPAFISLVLFAAHVSVLVDCRPMLQNDRQRPQQQQQRSFHVVARADAVGRFYLELRRPIKKGIQKYFGVILPVKSDTGNVVSIFDLRKKWLKSKRKLYNSRQTNKEDWLFYHIWLDLMNHQGAFNSTSRAQLRNVKKAELHAAHKEHLEPSSALLDLLVKRKRRSEEVNPSDPLGTHSLPSHVAKDYKDPTHGQHEQDQAGAVSKETIASCDDPLRVLQPQGPISPIKTNIAEWAEQH